ncbi:MAG: aminotransferase class IV [bacterium]|nr:aminotransferase class IV [bacterium]
MLLKAQFVKRRAQAFGLYEAFRWEPGTGYRNLHSHLRRLKHSCEYFSRPFPIKAILIALRGLRKTLGEQPNRIRPDVNGDDVMTTLLPEELGWPEAGVAVMIPQLRTDPEDPRLYHKTTIRPEKIATRAGARALGAHEGLFLNMRDEFTEGTLSSMMFRVGGQWITPALSCGLLPGVWRDQQIHSGRAIEGVVRYADLERIEEIVIGNSVRGEQRIIKIIREDGKEVYRDGSMDR